MKATVDKRVIVLSICVAMACGGFMHNRNNIKALKVQIAQQKQDIAHYKNLNIEKEKTIEDLEKEIENLGDKLKEIEKPQDTKSQDTKGSSSRGEVLRVLKMEATAYGATKLNGGAGTGITATGTTPIQGRTIAVDPKIIPLGAKVEVSCKGYPEINGIYIAEDTGGAIKSNRVDIYFNDLTVNPHEARKKMLNFGHRKVIVKILK